MYIVIIFYYFLTWLIKAKFLILVIAKYMTFKDLQKLVQTQSDPECQLLQRLKDKPFWIWDPQQHKQGDIKTKGDCCFNHIVGLPRKDRIGKSIWLWKDTFWFSSITRVLQSFKHNFKHKHLWVKKATGLGVTEFMLRIMAWLCLRIMPIKTVRCVLLPDLTRI